MSYQPIGYIAWNSVLLHQLQIELDNQCNTMLWYYVSELQANWLAGDWEHPHLLDQSESGFKKPEETQYSKPMWANGWLVALPGF